MNNQNTLQDSSLIAGIGLLIMAVLAGYANFGVLKNGGSHQLAGSLFAVGAVLDVLVAYCLFRIFAKTKKSLAYAMTAARIIYGLIFLVAAIILFNGNISQFNTIWDKALLLFALHLVLLSILVFKTQFAPKWLAVLLLLSGIGYAVDNIGKYTVHNYSLELASYTFIGEVVLIFWLFWIGFRK